MITEQEMIRLIVLFNSLKKNLRVSINNDMYQNWTFDGRCFRDYVIDETKKKIGFCFKEAKKWIK